MDAITCLSIPIEANSNSSTAERKNARKGTVKAKGERYIALLTPTGKSHWFFHGHIRDFDSKGCCVPPQRAAGVVMLPSNHTQKIPCKYLCALPMQPITAYRAHVTKHPFSVCISHLWSVMEIC